MGAPETLPWSSSRPARSPGAGFTLVELLVALAALSLMATLSWQGIDAMLRSDGALRAQSRAAQVLDTALGQWLADLDAAITLPGLPEMAWDGQTWRLLRRDPVDPGRGVFVVAWALRTPEAAASTATWVRWQAGPLRSRDEVRQAWELAARQAMRAREETDVPSVALMPLSSWQLAFFSQGRWSATLAAPVDAVRLQVTLPADGAARKPVTVDWLSPRVAGGRS